MRKLGSQVFYEPVQANICFSCEVRAIMRFDLRRLQNVFHEKGLARQDRI